MARIRLLQENEVEGTVKEIFNFLYLFPFPKDFGTGRNNGRRQLFSRGKPSLINSNGLPQA